MDGVIRKSLSDQVAQKVKNQILNIELPPGTRLFVEDLAEKFNVSRTPIREGLRELNAEGFVTYDNKTYKVSEYSITEIKDLFALRKILEVFAIRTATERMSDDKIKLLRKLCLSNNLISTGGDLYINFQNVDMKFHEIIGEGANIPQLSRFFTSVSERSWWIIRWLLEPQVSKSFNMQDTFDEHLAIVTAMENRDTEQVAKLMDEHMEKGEARILKMLENL